MFIIGNLDNTENTQKENKNYPKSHQPESLFTFWLKNGLILDILLCNLLFHRDRYHRHWLMSLKFIYNIFFNECKVDIP